MEWIVGIIVGLIVGGAATWLVRSARAKGEAASLQAEHRVAVAGLQAKLEQSDEAQAILDAAKEQLNEVFKSTASSALQNNNQAFLTLANENLGKTLETAKGELDRRHREFQELVKPLSENYGKLNPQIESLTTRVESVTKATTELKGALTDNRQVGNWGEVQLHRVVELAGMVEYCDFAEQSTIDGTGIIPDMVINLPNKRAVVVDAKASTAAFMESHEAADEDSASAALTKHANALKRQVDDLAKKNYGAKVDGSLDFVVMFVPGDQFLAAALRANPDLIDYGMQKRIAIVTPVSLISLLWAVHSGWQQERLARDAAEIKRVGDQMYNRMKTFMGHYQKVGSELGTAVTAFNRSIGSFDQSVAPQGRRFAELVTGSEDDFPEITAIDEDPRTSRYAHEGPTAEEGKLAAD